ncbi:hypothetical protein ACFFQW_19865 [Umezawaea endophytica]|uniref:PIN domain-containing protein n=1 Tax=Umezawaea endophytica TaxID=1654476 RepID=A0A9X2VP13_9PSEU|nr:hypothetical protein [Umezawaea endophytica]MCS7479664.1 hypothetical protein [Umezawaea endophytica]
MSLPRALLLDSSFLVAYERERNPRLAQAVVVQAITTDRPLIVPALSLLAAGLHLNGHHPDLSWVLDDPAGPIDVLTLSATNALETGQQAAQADPPDLVALEVAQIVVEAAGSPIVVMTYEPKLYAGTALHVIDMQPR